MDGDDPFAHLPAVWGRVRVSDPDGRTDVDNDQAAKQHRALLGLRQRSALREARLLLHLERQS